MSQFLFLDFYGQMPVCMLYGLIHRYIYAIVYGHIINDQPSDQTLILVCRHNVPKRVVQVLRRKGARIQRGQLGQNLHESRSTCKKVVIR